MKNSILQGWLYWQGIRIKHFVNYKKVVLVLTGDNHELDRQLLVHLDDFAKRKHAVSTIVFCLDEYKKEWTLLISDICDSQVEIYSMPCEKMAVLYSYYCYMKFFDNIVFSYTDTPKDNLLGTFLRETDVNEEDAACLALYHLRCVPDVRS